jgi:transcriptional regulator with XRE-family HTH domain
MIVEAGPINATSSAHDYSPVNRGRQESDDNLSETSDGRDAPNVVVVGMFADWIQQALKNAGITQAELGRRMSEKVRRTIDRAAVNKLTKNQRALMADELLAISEITQTPLPWGIQPNHDERPPSHLPTSRTPFGSQLIDEDRLRRLVVKTLEWKGVGHDLAENYATTLIEFSRNSPGRGEPRSDHDLQIEADAVIRLFSIQTPPLKG